MGHGKFGGKGMMFANPSFEQVARHWFNFLCANPVSSRWLILSFLFLITCRRLGEHLVDRLRMFSTHDRRQEVVLQPHPSEGKDVHHVWGQWTRKGDF
jgi:hypothetical protein